MLQLLVDNPLLVLGAALLVVLQRLLGLRPALVAGMYAGSFTNTPALAGALATCAIVLATLWIGYKLLRIPMSILVGMTAG